MIIGKFQPRDAVSDSLEPTARGLKDTRGPKVADRVQTDVMSGSPGNPSESSDESIIFLEGDTDEAQTSLKSFIDDESNSDRSELDDYNELDSDDESMLNTSEESNDKHFDGDRSKKASSEQQISETVKTEIYTDNSSISDIFDSSDDDKQKALKPKRYSGKILGKTKEIREQIIEIDSDSDHIDKPGCGNCDWKRQKEQMKNSAQFSVELIYERRQQVIGSDNESTCMSDQVQSLENKDLDIKKLKKRIINSVGSVKGKKTGRKNIGSDSDSELDFDDNSLVSKRQKNQNEILERSPIQAKKRVKTNLDTDSGSDPDIFKRFHDKYFNSNKQEKKRITKSAVQKQRRRTVRKRTTSGTVIQEGFSVKDDMKKPDVENLQPNANLKKIPCRRNHKGETPMHVACIKGDFERVKKLIDVDHDVNAQDYASWTPLHEAVNHNHIEIVDYLLSHGAEIDKRGDGEVTPLIDAASCGNVQVMKLLIERGANCSCRDKTGLTALDTLLNWHSNPVGDAEFISVYKEVVDHLTKYNNSAGDVGLSQQSENQIRLNQRHSPVPGSSKCEVDRSEIQLGHSDLDYSLMDIEDSSEKSTRKITETDEGRNPDSKEGTFTLLIPSKLTITYHQLAAIYREQGINSNKSVVWPPFDKLDSLTDEHLPYLMLDVLKCIRKGDLDSLALVLSTVGGEIYNYFRKSHSEQRATGKLFCDIADEIEAINKPGQPKVAWLMSRISVKVLVIYLSENILGHKDIIGSLQRTLFRWDHSTSMKDTFRCPKRIREELTKIWNWLMSKIRTSFQVDIYPQRQSLSHIEKIHFSDEFSSTVTIDLVKELLKLRCSLQFDASYRVFVQAIDGASRHVLKYKEFLRRVIETLAKASNYMEIFYIISTAKTDDVDFVQTIVPSHLVRCAKVYTAFSPEQVCPSCIIIHMDLNEMETVETSSSIKQDSLHKRSESIREGSSSSGSSAESPSLLPTSQTLF